VDRETVISWLLRPELLILRRSSELTEETLGRDTFFSLGHDALGSALREWSLREAVREREEQLRRDEEIARKQAERRAKWRTRMAVVAGCVGAIAAFWSLGAQLENANFRIAALIAAANRSSWSDLSIGVRAAVESVAATESLLGTSDKMVSRVHRLVANALYLMPDLMPETFQQQALRKSAPTLARLISSAPVQVVPRVGSNPDVFVLQSTPGGHGPGFLFWDNRRAEIFGARDNDRQIVDVVDDSDDITRVVAGPDGRLVTIADASTGPVVRLPPDSRSYDQKYFLQRSSKLPQSNVTMRIIGNLVLLYTVPTGAQGRQVIIEAFIPPTGSDKEFRHGGTYRGELPDNATIVDRFLVLAKRRPKATAGAKDTEQYHADASSPARPKHVEVEKVSVWDLGDESSQSDSLGLPDDKIGQMLDADIALAATQCLAVNEKSEKTCPVRTILSPQDGDSHFIKLAAPRSSPTYDQSLEVNDTLFIVDLREQRNWRIDLAQLDHLRKQVAGSEDVPLPDGALLGPTTDVVVGSTATEIVVGFAQDRYIDVFRITDQRSEYVGALFPISPIAHWVFSNDGTLLLARAQLGRGAYTWSVVQPVKERASDLLKEQTPTQLVQLSCDKGLLKGDPPDRREWFGATGLTDGPPPDRCKRS
jgi:hypothetical protein